MTHSGGQPHNVGDRGQRYQVSYLPIGPGEYCGVKMDPLPTGDRQIFGWADSLEGARSFCEAIRLHPSMTLAEIVDRQTGEIVT